ncbi:hypothetical protein D3C75_969640 [compost metagenome]
MTSGFFWNRSDTIFITGSLMVYSASRISGNSCSLYALSRRIASEVWIYLAFNVARMILMPYNLLYISF